MKDSPERDLAVADELGRMADARIKELEAENTALREQLAEAANELQCDTCNSVGNYVRCAKCWDALQEAYKSQLAQVEKERDNAYENAAIIAENCTQDDAARDEPFRIAQTIRQQIGR